MNVLTLAVTTNNLELIFAANNVILVQAFSYNIEMRGAVVFRNFKIYHRFNNLCFSIKHILTSVFHYYCLLQFRQMCSKHIFFTLLSPLLHHLNQQIPLATVVSWPSLKRTDFWMPSIHIKFPYHDMSGQTEENSEKNLVYWLVLWLRFEAGAFRIRNRIKTVVRSRSRICVALFSLNMLALSTENDVFSVCCFLR
jgi:hypothetical protein